MSEPNMESPLVGTDDETRVMLCVDNHDAARGATALGFLQWIIGHSQAAGSSSGKWNVAVFGHVHQDTHVPFIRGIGKAIGMHLPDKAERARTLKEMAEGMAAELRASLRLLEDPLSPASPASSDEAMRSTVHAVVDDSDLSMVEAYPKFVRSFCPHLMVINERHEGDFHPLGTEISKIQHALAGKIPTVIFVKRDARPLPSLAEPAEHIRHLALVDPTLSDTSKSTIVTAAGILGQGCDRLHFLSCWSLPDVATAMYSDDARWDQELKKRENEAKAAACEAAALFRALRPDYPPEAVGWHAHQDKPTEGVKHFVKKYKLFNVIVGGGVVRKEQQPQKHHSFSLAKRRFFGTTADAVLKVSGCGAVTIAY
ncbi:hypothetical protein DIPPA_00736 [Diplonema papillatum]|nr:hypothetical protein DIPPA_00736 [Diplonema papillatum]